MKVRTKHRLKPWSNVASAKIKTKEGGVGSGINTPTSPSSAFSSWVLLFEQM
jgi:hypothetical protein